MNKQDIPNYLTYGRVLAVPVALALMWGEPSWSRTAMFTLFLLAVVSDFLDGHLARKWKVESFRGALLDPIADKLLVAVMLLFLITRQVEYEREIVMHLYSGELRIPSVTTVTDTMGGYTLWLPITLIILREIYVSGLREFLSSLEVLLPVSSGGKWKTALQMLSILALLYAFSWPNAKLWEFGGYGLWIAALLGLYTAYDYTRKSWTHLK